MKHVKLGLVLLLISSPAWAERPEWTRHTERQVLGGDIVHWGMGEAKSPDIALFKARQMAIKAMIEECGGIANKQIIPRKQYVDSEDYGSSRAYATVSLAFDSCEAGKRHAKNIENPKIAEEQKLYEKLLGFDDNPQVIADTEAKIRDLLKGEREATDQQVGALKEDIDSLRAEMHSQPQPVQPARLPASSSMKLMCQRQAQQMRARLQMKASQYGGNVADPALWGDYNAYQQQAQMCARME